MNCPKEVEEAKSRLLDELREELFNGSPPYGDGPPAEQFRNAMNYYVELAEKIYADAYTICLYLDS